MTFRTALLLGAALVVPASLVPAAPAHAQTPWKRVLLIDINGMHRTDFEAWNHYANFGIGTDPLRTFLLNGFTFTNAITSAPSNDYPGMVAQVTGSTPKTSGIYYDKAYDRSYFAPSNTACTGSPGAVLPYNESIDIDSTQLNGGGTLGAPMTQIDKAKLPLGPACHTIAPHQLLKVNTVFEVVKLQIPGARTAWADIHPSFEILNGPSGTGVDDLFTPEIKAINPATGKDYTQSYIDARKFDLMNVQAVLNEIDGLDSTGTKTEPVPTVFGMNFESVTVGQQLATAGADDPTPPAYFAASKLYSKNSGGNLYYIGGYITASPSGATDGQCVIPGFWNSALVSEQYGCPGVTGDPVMQLSQLDFVSYEIGGIVNELTSKGLLDTTLFIITARTGNSPIDGKTRKAVRPELFGAIVRKPASALGDYDDVALMWLNPATRTMSSYDTAQANLSNNFAKLHLQYLLSNNQLTSAFASPFTDPRVPDFIGLPLPGTLYLETGDTTLAKPGGFSDDDRDVMLVVSALGSNKLPNSGNPGVNVLNAVETRQIAPTILYALGITPSLTTPPSQSPLQGVVQEGTQPLPVPLY